MLKVERIGVEGDGAPGMRGAAKFDLTVSLDGAGGGKCGKASLDTTRICSSEQFRADEPALEGMHLERVMEWMVGGGERQAAE